MQYSAPGSPTVPLLTPSCCGVAIQLRERGEVIMPWPSTRATSMADRVRRRRSTVYIMVRGIKDATGTDIALDLIDAFPMKSG